jgi:hypothetical protein
LETGSKLGQLLQNAFKSSGIPYEPKVEVRYGHTAAVLANAGIGIAIVDVFTAHFLSNFAVTVRPFEPAIRISSSILTRSALPASRLIQDFAREVGRAFSVSTIAGIKQH